MLILSSTSIMYVVMFSNFITTHYQLDLFFLNFQSWYFFRIIVVFNLIWLPGMFLVIFGGTERTYYYNLAMIGYLFCGIQPIVSTCLAMMKSDVRKYTIDLITLSYLRKAPESTTTS